MSDCYTQLQAPSDSLKSSFEKREAQSHICDSSSKVESKVSRNGKPKVTFVIARQKSKVKFRETGSPKSQVVFEVPVRVESREFSFQKCEVAIVKVESQKSSL